MQSHESKEATETQSTHNYPFIKPASHFTQEEKTNTNYTKLKKVYKTNSSDERNSSIWYLINNQLTKEEYRARLNRIIVLMGELFRLLDDILPKYRIYKSDKEELAISKGVKGAITFEQHAKVYKEGMGRGLLGKFIYRDLDAHFQNALVDENGYLNVIDQDRCFPSVTSKMHTNEVGDYSYQTVADYENLPVFSNYNPGGWEWNHNPAFAEELSNHPDFLNEKHFAAMKLALTVHLQSLLVEYHLKDSEDEDDITEALTSQLKYLVGVCQQSEAFHSYAKAHRLSALCAILYEVNQFFKSNKHYLSAFNKSSKDLLQEESEYIVQIYSELLVSMDEPALSDKEFADIKRFIIDIDRPTAIADVRRFYHEQNMKIRVFLLDKVGLEADIKEFFSNWATQKTSFAIFIKFMLAQYQHTTIDPLLSILRYITASQREILPEIVDLLTDTNLIYPNLTAEQKSYVVQHLFLIDRAAQAKELMQSNPEIDLNTHDSFTRESIIHLLVQDEKPNLETIRYLCEEAEPRALVAIDKTNTKTALSLAIKYGHYDVATYFIDQADIRKQFTTEQMTYAAMKLIEAEQFALASKLIINPLELLHLALKESKPNIAVFKYVCEESKQELNLAKGIADEKTILITAAKESKWEVINYFISKPELIKQFSEDQIVLMIALLFGLEQHALGLSLLKIYPHIEKNHYNELFEMVLEHKENRMELITAICALEQPKLDFEELNMDKLKSKMDVIKYFISKPELITRFNEKQISNLFYDLVQNDQELALQLFKVRIDLDANQAPDSHSTLPINRVLEAENPNVELVQFMCEMAHPPIKLSKEGHAKNALITALDHGHFEIAHYFIRTPFLINQLSATEIGDALTWLIVNNQPDLLASLMKSRPDAECAHLTYTDKHHNSALHIAVAEDKPNIELIKTLVKMQVSEDLNPKCTLHITNDNNETALRIAITKGNPEVLKILLAYVNESTPWDDVSDAIQLIVKQEPATDLLKLLDYLKLYQDHAPASSVTKRQESSFFIKSLISRAQTAEMVMEMISTLITKEKQQPFLHGYSMMARTGLFKYNGIKMSDSLAELVRFAKSRIHELAIGKPAILHEHKVIEFLGKPTQLRELIASKNPMKKRTIELL